MVVKLLVVSGPTTKKDVTLRRPRTVVGRKKGCKIRIQSESVSRIHCSLVIQDGRLTVKDLGSSNGTFVNGQRIKEQVLQAGDRLQVGVIKFQVQLIASPGADERPAEGDLEPTMAVPIDEDDVVFFETDEPAAAAGHGKRIDAEDDDEAKDPDANIAALTEEKSQPVPASENIFLQDDNPAFNVDDFVFPESVIDEAGYRLADSTRPGPSKPEK